MKYKNFPAIVMLTAGAIASIICIINRVTLLNSLKVTLVVLLIFYVIGIIAGKILLKINQDADAAVIQKKRDALMSDDELLITKENDINESEAEFENTEVGKV